MVEVEGVNAGLLTAAARTGIVARWLDAGGFQFHIGEQLYGRRDTQSFGGGLSDRRLDLAARQFQIQLLQLLFLERMKASPFGAERFERLFADERPRRGARRRSSDCWDRRHERA